MGQGICSGCGLEHHLCLVIHTDGAVDDFLPKRQYCETCGSYLAGIIVSVERTMFKPMFPTSGG
jgi:hypothetical protein